MQLSNELLPIGACAFAWQLVQVAGSFSKNVSTGQTQVSSAFLTKGALHKQSDSAVLCEGELENGGHGWHVSVFEIVLLYVPLGHSAHICPVCPS